jgi:hypothetical protein
MSSQQSCLDPDTMRKPSLGSAKELLLYMTCIDSTVDNGFMGQRFNLVCILIKLLAHMVCQ